VADWTELPSGLLVPSRPRKPTAVDLFCGCGGFSLGLMEAGFDVLCGIEIDCDAAHTYMVNLGTYPVDLRFVEESDRGRFARHLNKRVTKRGLVRGFAVSGSARKDPTDGVPVFWLGDVRQLSGKQILESIDLEVGELDLLVGGPPCQGYSMAGRRNVMDPRNSLVFEFARLVCEMKPKTICMENVPGMLSMVTETGASVVDELCEILERGSYGEFEAMRAVLTGERRMVKRGAGKRADRATIAQPPDERVGDQLGLFALEVVA
jgi:DNA (cytosine-5)-methyltransferase 1